MAKTRVHVVHDQNGRIVAISRPAKDKEVVVASGDGQSVFETEVDDGDIHEIVSGRYIADPIERAVKPAK